MDLTNGPFLSLPAVVFIIVAVLAEACAVAFVLDRVSLSERAYRAWLLALLLLAWAATCFVAYAVRSTA